MVQVSKHEAELLQERLDAFTCITGKKKSGKRKKYYVEETRAVIKLLSEIRCSKL